jgi:hypothetical protein
MADDQANVTGAVASLGRALITALPPGFLLLCLLNVIFLGCVMWFIDHMQAQRTELVAKVLDRCFEVALQHEPPPH